MLSTSDEKYDGQHLAVSHGLNGVAGNNADEHVGERGGFSPGETGIRCGIHSLANADGGSDSDGARDGEGRRKQIQQEALAANSS